MRTPHQWEHIGKDTAVKHIGKDTAVNHMKGLLDEEVTYDTASPLKASISSFRVANSISLSYTKEGGRLQPADWLTKPVSVDSSEVAATKVSEDVIFKRN